MKKRASLSNLSLIFTSFVLIISQQSYGSKQGVEEEITHPPVCSKESQMCYGDFDTLWEDILMNHILPQCDQKIIEVNRSFFTLVTGYLSDDMFDYNLKNQPKKPVCYISNNAVIDFKDIQQISSFVWYSLIRHVKNVRSPYWPYFKGSHIQTVDLRENNIGDNGARDFGQSLQGTQVHTVDLSLNKIGDKGARALGQSLTGTQVHTVYLIENNISQAEKQNLELALKDSHIHLKF